MSATKFNSRFRREVVYLFIILQKQVLMPQRKQLDWYKTTRWGLSWLDLIFFFSWRMFVSCVGQCCCIPPWGLESPAWDLSWTWLSKGLLQQLLLVQQLSLLMNDYGHSSSLGFLWIVVAHCMGSLVWRYFGSYNLFRIWLQDVLLE